MMPIGRRTLLGGGGALALAGGSSVHTSRVRPGDSGWPGPAEWAALDTAVDGNLAFPISPLTPCRTDPGGAACRSLFAGLKNPYRIGDDPALTQTCAWVDAWTAQPSAAVVAAHTPAHVAAAVRFAAQRNLRLVVRGGGHSYLGTSTAPDSLMVWTRDMDAITLHEGFRPRGLARRTAPLPAVSVGAGAIWGRVYDAVTTKGGRYVQGGGCLTVGVAGLVQGGGFGTFSKAFGTAAASLLEAELVTADGAIRTVNAGHEPDLFWALKGGGGGSFGVVTRVTLRTWDLPDDTGWVGATIAAGDAAYRRLLAAFIAHYADRLCNSHWGELVVARPDNHLEIGMNAQGLGRDAMTAAWQPFFDWVAAEPGVRIATGPSIVAGAMRHRWDPDFLTAHLPQAIQHDDRPGASRRNIFWTANRAEAGHVIHGFESVWLPAVLLDPAQQPRLTDALWTATRWWPVEMHFQKGLAGAPPHVLAAARNTATNPAVLDAFMLAIIASEGPPAFPSLSGHEPDVAKARHDAARIAQAAAALRQAAPARGAYVVESDYHQSDWQRAYWGANYSRLLAIKRRYDPDGVFFVRHGVGSEGWSDDGFTRLA